MHVLILSLLSSLLLWPIVATAQLYKWHDEQGNLHITDTPPPPIEKKSAPAVTSKSATVSLARPERPQAEVTSTSTNDAATQLSLPGLSLDQATLTSAWQTFEGAQVNAKAPAQRWKDGRGVEQVGDLRPVTTPNEEMTSVPTNPSVSRTAIGVKKRATAASRTRHRLAR